MLIEATPRGLFCQPRNAVRPAFLRMIRELLRFNMLRTHYRQPLEWSPQLIAQSARARVRASSIMKEPAAPS